MDQAAENEGAAVLLDPVGGHQIHLAAEQFFKAIGQVDEAETDGLREARQSIHVDWWGCPDSMDRSLSRLLNR